MNKSLVAIGLATGLAVTAPAFAQQASPAAAGAQAQKPPMTVMNKSMEGRRAVVGKVIDTRTMQVKGPGGKVAEHRLVKLQNKANKVVVVNLGLAERAPNPKKGQTFVALGKEARLNGRPIVFANYVGDLQPAGALMPKK